MNSDMKMALAERRDMQAYLFDKGFLITDADIQNSTDYPFFGNWEKTQAGNYFIWVHKRTRLHFIQVGDRSFFLIGHAYNPFSGVISEQEILTQLSKRFPEGDYQQLLDELTGVYIVGVITQNEMILQLDASGMQYGCYGTIDGKQYVSSHMQLIGDICSLEQSNYVKRLVGYRWYKYMMGNYMPGQLTCFQELKRIIPNTEVRFSRGGIALDGFTLISRLKWQMMKTSMLRLLMKPQMFFAIPWRLSRRSGNARLSL